jgi:PAS domain S-box-containing protein
LRDYEQSLERLIGVVQDVSMARDLDQIMAIVKIASRELTGADGATFILRDGDLCHYADEDAIAPLWKGQRFPMSTCISGWVMLNHQPAFIEDIYADTRIPPDSYRPTFVKSLAMVPIRSKRPIGAIGNYWAKSHATTETEIKVLQALADAVSVAIQNVELIDQLQSSHQLFSAFMDYAPVGATIRDKSGRFLFVNDRMAAIYGKKPDELLNKSLIDIVAPAGRDIAARSLAEDQQVLARKELITHNYAAIGPDGNERHYVVTKFPIQDPAVEQLGIISVDITERVESERAREAARVQLHHAYRMAALGEMAGGIAHEINNPAAIVIGKARQMNRVLDKDQFDVQTVRDFAAAITSAAERITGIVNGLSTISRQADHDPKTLVSIASIIDGTVAVIASKFKQGGVRLTVKDFDRELKAPCRPPEISQVLLNLLSNAFDAVEALDDKWVEIAIDARTNGEDVAICVTDGGRGIPLEIAERIMTPFFTTKPFGKGTGLGLSVSHGIAVSHGGSLSVDQGCQNTRFVLRLPLA